MTDRELMQQALEALEDACGGRCNAENNPCWQRSVTNALRDRLAQPEQEPVAWSNEIINVLHALYDSEMIKENDSGDALIRLDAAIAAVEEAEESHKAPPQRPWVGLTDEEIHAAFENSTRRSIYEVIEAKLKEKNT